jgi:hypothetical protein
LSLRQRRRRAKQKAWWRKKNGHRGIIAWLRRVFNL